MAGWPPFGRGLLCSLCVLACCGFANIHFGFEGGLLVLIAPVRGHYLSFTFYYKYYIYYKWYVRGSTLHGHV